MSEKGAFDGDVNQHNPYTSPQTADPSFALGPVFSNVDDPTTLGRISIVLLITTTVIDLFNYFLIPQLSSNSPLAGTSSILDTVSGWLLLTYIVIFMCWSYRVLRNAKRVAPDRMTVSPGLGVGSYFIPILNFWIPVKALLQASRITGTSTGLVLVWWIATQALLVVAIVYGVWLFSDDSITPVMIDESGNWESQDDWITTFIVLMDPVVTAIEVPMVWGLCKRQREWVWRS